MIIIEDLKRRFTYHPPSHGSTINAHERVRATLYSAAETIVSITRPSREQALAITALEEAMMWANAAIARYQETAP